MPQLAQLALVYQSQWFWLLIVLGVIYFFVGRGIVPKVEETVDQRDAQIAADLAAAEHLRAEAATAEEAWRATINEAHAEAQAVTAKAKEEAAKDADKRVAAADKRLAKKLDEASAALDEARRSALTEVEAMAADATREIVAKLTGSKVDDAAARTAVAEALSRA
ncbi:ATPase [Altererythrobacter salegens]|uniref:ATP synthase subunit b n=1 Tax=Croceibacterium salegens TaxID=1737568 RepID=A0A6I4STA8_9SPHN|nr:ATPase [Croceibacterium salegens]MXO59153.1 ATPase [Croceibacterium salegens]